MYPGWSVTIPGFTVNPGDVIRAQVHHLSGNQYALRITNTSTAEEPFQTIQTLLGDRSSAEWVMEAPSSGRILPLADFHNVTFTDCAATVDGVTGPVSQWPHDAMAMVKGGRKSVEKAVPTALASAGTAFSVIWLHQ